MYSTKTQANTCVFVILTSLFLTTVKYSAIHNQRIYTEETHGTNKLLKQQP